MPEVAISEEIIQKCKNAEDSKKDCASARQIGDRAMVAAVVLFTMDTAALSQKTFYGNLNKHLRTRAPAFLQAGHGYFFLMMTALSRLPPVSGTVYRGIDREKAKDALAKMPVGQSIHWSGFTSTSPEKAEAEAFAAGGGILFRIQLLDRKAKARDISELSVFPYEKEVLLLPNFKAVVVSHGKESGITIVDTIEQLEDVQVDY